VARAKTSYVCRECGYISARWLGRCPGCSRWNTIIEEVGGGEAGFRSTGRRTGAATAAPVPVILSEVDPGKHIRISTGLSELDRVLGGGLVAGSVVLLGGEPGVGKSTLLLQALLRMEAGGVFTLLVSGEESAAQVKLRSDRLQGGRSGLCLLSETQTEAVVGCLERDRPAVCVIDSIQTLWSPDVGSAPGSVVQIRDAAGRLVRVAKSYDIALILVGHVTKDGELAGPRVLEHMVDAVLSFEGERARPFRILRGVKNRFGSTNEVGVFQMAEQGLVEVADPSSLFLEEGDLRSGSAVVPVVEGSRCLLAEVQALVAPSSLAIPQRVARGVDRSRLAMIVAVLSRRARLPLLKCDIFVNVAGGLVIEDPAADLAVALAVVSAWHDGDEGHGVAAFGEISLTGRVRYVLQAEQRLQELTRRGFDRVFLPSRNVDELTKNGRAGVHLEAITDIGQAVIRTGVRSARG
jgi:DNA repair protein RadA/Sms